MRIRPLGDRIIVKRLENDHVSDGGIVIPDTVREKPLQGEVLAVGSGRVLDNGSRKAPDIKAGERVMFGKYSGTEIQFEGQELLIMREGDVMGVVDG